MLLIVFDGIKAEYNQLTDGGLTIYAIRPARRGARFQSYQLA